MSKADIYVYLDNVQFEKNGFQNRNRILSGWLTVPVTLKGHTTGRIKDIRIANVPWRNKYLGKLENCYKDSPNYDRYSDEIDGIVMADYEYLAELNYELINFFKKYLDIHTPTIEASALGVTGKGSDLILNICKELKADTYLSGPSGRNYLDIGVFEKAGIDIEYHDYPHPPEIFSALDFIMRNNDTS